MLQRHLTDIEYTQITTETKNYLTHTLWLTTKEDNKSEFQNKSFQALRRKLCPCQ